MAREQSPHAHEQCVGTRRGAIGEVIWQRLVVQQRRRGPRREQRLDLRRKVEGAVIRVHVVQRLHAQAIPGEEELLPPAVPDGEREHPPESVERLRALFLVEVEQGLSVTTGVIAMPGSLQGDPEFLVVVDLAVVHDVERPAVVVHRLMPARHVDDREAAMRQPHATFVEDAEIVRATMRHRVAHQDERLGIHQAPRPRREGDPANPAHRRQLPPREGDASLPRAPLPTGSKIGDPAARTVAPDVARTATCSAPKESTSHGPAPSTSTRTSAPCRQAAM